MGAKIIVLKDMDEYSKRPPSQTGNGKLHRLMLEKIWCNLPRVLPQCGCKTSSDKL
jgi:hypothetical protein